MQLNADRTITYETRPCHCATYGPIAGKQYASKACPVCHGTARTKGGKGVGRCRSCYTGTVQDKDNYRQCTNCNGTASVPEHYTDTVPQHWLDAMPITVERNPTTRQTLHEAYIGSGLYSVTDYGAHKHLTDDALIAKERPNIKHVQACKLLIQNRLATRLVIRTNNNGYSILATE